MATARSGKIIAVCTSRKKGTRKNPAAEGIFLVDFGLRDDAHAAGGSHRQVSLLSTNSIEKMQKLGLKVGPGDFAENLTIEGLDLMHLPIGTRLTAGKEVTLQITQIGKECHTRCAIYRQVGQCVMPEEGVFARVLSGGIVHPGDRVTLTETHAKQSGSPDAGLQT